MQEKENTGGEGQTQASLFRAAEYVRMSTEHQQYSTENQADKIREYAARRGIEIIKTYADEGKSGLRIDGRQALQQLIKDVETGAADFQVILVYDVSRWGRFQDADESASIEELLWLAIDLRLDAKYFFVDGLQLSNPDSTLVKRNVPQRVMANRNRREAFTRQLNEIRLSCEFCSSGLWNDKGQMLAYDLLDLPFDLVRRIAAWQDDFDETENPPATGDDAWWDRHEQEAISIATALQETLGTSPVVKLYRKDGWLSIAEINRSDGGES